MFEHVLIPTDGSRLSKRAAKAAIRFAKQVGARVTVYCAVAHYPPYAGHRFVALSTVEEFESGARRQGQKYVDDIAKLAKAALVPCEARISMPATADRGIIEVARKSRCDVIFIGSHGRSGVVSAVLGSVTSKVLAHTKIPVVVFR